MWFVGKIVATGDRSTPGSIYIQQGAVAWLPDLVQPCLAALQQVDHPTRRSHEDAEHAISMHRTCWGAYGVKGRKTRSDRSKLIGQGSGTSGHIQSDLAIPDLDIVDTLLYRMARNLNGAHQPISPCYNGRTMYTVPDRFFKNFNPYSHTNDTCYTG